MAISSGHADNSPARGALFVDVLRSGDQSTLVVICGEVDLANHHVLADRLAEVPLTESSHVQLELAGLTFADCRAVAQLSGFVRGARQRGCHVIVSDPTPLLRRLAVLLGVEHDFCAS